jgi:cytochrome c-type biogenesis protein CcmH
MKQTAAILLALAWISGLAFAIQPGEALSDPALEARARALSQNLRCVVCQNQSIDDSDAELAKDLRLLLRERLLAGDSDEAATNFIVARYGNYVLLTPPFQSNTYALWLIPFAATILGLGLIYRLLRNQPEVTEEDE